MSEGRVECTFFWFIENYSYCWHNNGEGLLSPPFTADGLEGTAWRLIVYPRGYRDEDKRYISLLLCRDLKDKGPETVSIEYELSIPSLNGPRTLSGKNVFERNNGRVFVKLLQLDELRLRRKADYLPNDTLTVQCKIWKGEGNVNRMAPVCTRSYIPMESISYFHSVDKFSKIQPNQRKTVKINSHLKNNCMVSSDVYCSEGNVIVEITSSDANYTLCKRKIYLLDISGNLIACGEADNRLDFERKDIQKLTLSISRQNILAEKYKYLPDDRLNLLCECVFSNGLNFPKREGSQYETPTASVELDKCTAIPSSLSKNVDRTIKSFSAFPSGLEDIKSLYLNQSLTDVELKTETRSFKAHKIVLCARSPVFNAMLTSDMKEKFNNCIQVNDLEDDVVQQLLLFLYSDNIENLQWNTATRLYYAADKYQIGGLKKLCSSFLAGNLNTSTVTELLVLADTHNDTDLKKLVEDFILQHEEQVFGSKEWEKLIETHPLLVIKTMHLKYKRKK